MLKESEARIVEAFARELIGPRLKGTGIKMWLRPPISGREHWQVRLDPYGPCRGRKM